MMFARILLVFLGVLLAHEVSAQTVTSPPGCPVATGCTFSGPVIIPGTTTNDNAPAGDVGEYISSEVLAASAVTLTTTVAANITSISLTPGDWYVWGTVGFIPTASTTVTEMVGTFSTTSATVPSVPPSSVMGYVRQRYSSVAVVQVFPVGGMRISIANTTTVYLVAESTFSGGSGETAYGFIAARRAR